MDSAGSQSYLAYIAETVFGTTPATPELISLRTTGNGLNLTKEAIQSEEIREDRQITDVRHGSRSVAGDFGVELSHNAFDDFLEAALGGTWATNVLKAGTVFRSFTMEKGFTDIDQYLVYLGCVVNSLSVNFAPNQMATASFGIIGKDMVDPAATSIDTTPGLTPSAGNEPFDGFTGTINEGGSAIATITGIELSLENGISQNHVIGQNTVRGLTLGRSNITGQLTAFFEDETLINKFTQETISSLDFTLTRGSDTLKFDLPSLKFMGADVPVVGETSTILTLPFQALRDDTEESNIVITRSS